MDSELRDRIFRLSKAREGLNRAYLELLQVYGGNLRECLVEAGLEAGVSQQVAEAAVEKYEAAISEITSAANLVVRYAAQPPRR